MVTVTQSPTPKKTTRPKAGNLDDFALRVRRARRDLVLTIQGFSTASGIPTSTLKNYELGHSKPTAENLQKMFAAGVNPMWVLLGHPPVLLIKPKFTAAQKAKLLLRKQRAALAREQGKVVPPTTLSETPVEDSVTG